MSEPRKPKPLYVAKVGNVSVPVVKNGSGRVAVIWTDVDGERQRATYSLKRRYRPSGLTGRKMAELRADEVALAISNSLADVITLSSADRDNYRLAMQALAPLGIPLAAAIEEYVAARKAIPGHTLLEAANFFSRGHIERKACPPTSDIVSALLLELQDDRREDRKYIKPLKRDLDKFAKAFPDLQAATEDSIRRYLAGLKLLRAARGRKAGEPVSARRRDNVREAIVRLMRYARKREFIPEDKTSPAERIPKLAEGGEVSTYNPEQLAKILHHFATSDPDWLPWAAISAFAGLRTSEILRLDWSRVRWTESVISVSGKIARKVRTSRKPPILPPLAAWLTDYRNATGPVIPRKWKDMEAAHCDALNRCVKALGWPSWANNAMRHSFGSHRLAIVKSEDQVAYEMGNSPAKVRENYNDPKSETEALRYFNVLPPERAENIVSITSSK